MKRDAVLHVIKRVSCNSFDGDRAPGTDFSLEHTGRVATMGQPRASITHELKDAVAATIMNAETALRWLERPPPDLEKAQQAIDRIAEDGKRAAKLVRGLRLAKEASARRGDVEINETIRK
jgi:C4-dicarboxylate-specific signal transduction histidine kinase